MSYSLHQFAFQYYPYIAVAVLLIGSWARYDKAMYTWRTGSSQMLSDKGMRIGSNCFHIGILAILGGHLVGLLTPHAVYEHFITSSQKQMLAMVVGGVFGALCFIGISILLVRRLFNARVRATGSFGDTLVLVLLFAQLCLGLYSIRISSGHLDGAVMVQLAEWAQHIVTFRAGAADYIEGVSWVYKMHIFLGLTLFLIAPFTRLVHVWSIPISYLWRPYQVVRRRQATLRYGPRE
ncbi:respiratory nitrate reductase subunit gamma [Stenotrophomonas maltophilia]|jgi:nitrate reductase gamma subunit|uniref:Respiratory nitrate reductase subunit gamma n=1 Tax=Stenotrophomonas riyadhensis TaxID=2859893 RepID=A0ABT2XDX5_9GAMM|nr:MULTISPECIES: respiratory nitrate reductase subunit gamma [Stenotrophomonas]MBH1619354.1 respiratory nitrate reductase subunit gamma [Stenotrophomonas maltophilia]MCV0323856.1 respiratory nitrate reductase subunit gamma [Stenotrophomonas sp. CFS3442]MRI42523.1 respiratory nitrate reductase subunit gamma [Stenotrophomonas sp. MH181796]RRU70790.1 respiratory nitrate reductase subunit gamma [Stenotrophomonas maltophilia]HEL4245041.1 respiratory nitrate reductase subunit gamma [Stenotrophomonas